MNILLKMTITLGVILCERKPDCVIHTTTQESLAHGDHLRILLNGGIRFCKGGDLRQAVKLVQLLAAIWNFILAQNNSNDEDDDMDECPEESKAPDGDEETAPQPKPTLQPSNIAILNRYFR